MKQSTPKKPLQQWRVFLSRIFYLTGLALVLWIPFNGIRHTLWQEAQLNQLSEQLAQHQGQVLAAETQVATQNEAQNGSLDPFGSPERTTPGYTDAVGFIDIPKIDERMALFMGASEDHLARGAAHISGTNLPLGGKGSHSVIAGHRGWYGNSYFVNINQLAPGDLIYVSYFGKERYYVVTGSELIDPWEVERLQETDPDLEQLTLLTCDPLFYTWHRLLVHSRALTAEEEEKLLNGKVSFEDLDDKTPVSWDGQKGQQTSQGDPFSQPLWSQFLTVLRPKQYFVYWLLLGAGSISWGYTAWQLVKQIGRGLKISWRKVSRRRNG